jgi:hypothetical protein
MLLTTVLKGNSQILHFQLLKQQQVTQHGTIGDHPKQDQREAMWNVHTRTVL